MADKFYSIRDLQLFKEFTRATWTAEHGTQPKQFIVKDRIKRWSDPTCNPTLADPQSLRTYLVWDSSAQSQREITMTALEAFEVNLPGKFTWPKYTAAVSVATVIGPDGTKYPFNHRLLLSKEQIDTLLAKLNNDLPSARYSAIQTNDDERFPWRVIWGEEARRQWKLVRDGDLNATKEAALVYEMMVSKGIDAPGKFTETQIGGSAGHWEVGWTSEVPNDDPHNSLPEVPVPMRKLRIDERVQPSPFGDMVYSINEVDTPASSKDMAELRSLLKEILAELKKSAKPPFVGE